MTMREITAKTLGLGRAAGRAALPALLLAALVLAGALRLASAAGPATGQATYLGAKACQECHEEQYASFSKNSKKAHSFNSIKVMRKGLAESELKKCYECHTTGYGQPGGFRSEAETPHLKDAGCEVCHGPGSVHKESQDPKDIRRKLSTKQCETCHNAERVGAFRFRPLIFGGAH
jgi:hypothetical protein